MKTQRKKYLTLFSSLMVVIITMSFSCKNGKDLLESKENPENPKPEWVNNRPVVGSHYIGIGAASKTSQPLDYADVARKNALNDLAQGISVTVQGTTFLNSLEVNKNFSEEFISTIATTTDEKISDYETAGQWENGTEFWVFYRLNKALYQQQKLEKKNQAMNSAYDYWMKGQEAEKRANIPSAFDLYFHGLFAMKEYWNEVNEYETDSSRIYLDNEIYSSLQRITTGMVVTVEQPNVVLSAENNYQQVLDAAVMYNSKPVRGITVLYHYETDRYTKPKPLVTDEQGRIKVPVSDIPASVKDKKVSLRMDLEPLLPADLDRTITSTFVKNMKTDRRDVEVDLITPSFFIESDENYFGKDGASIVLANSVQSKLAAEAYRIATTKTDANYVIKITSNTTQGGTSQGFHVALLDYNFEVKKNVTNEIMFQRSENNIKGLQLNADAAGVEAYKKCKEKMENEIVKAMLESLF
ncbi:MAG: LPP20 family lipoprotein [Flavobacteriales bacterium]|nr:LPP20 family lipoprotein [Flavobacteriales bacterium]